MSENLPIAPEPATAADIEELLALREGAGSWMRARGDPVSPIAGAHLAPRLTTWISRGQVFVLREGESIIGHIRLTREASLEIWGGRGRDGRAGYIGMLGRHPQRGAPGTGERLLAWGERQITAWGRELVRLDTITANRRLVRYYEERGYRPTGSAAFESVSLTLFEKRLV